MNRHLFLFALLPAVALAGCTIADSGPLDDVIAAAGSGDLGMDMTDTPDMSDPPDMRTGMEAVDRCGDDSAFVISQTIEQLRVDTRELQNRENPPCAPSGGRDGFFALDVQAGEYWHFHLAVDPSVAGQEDLNPVLYLLQEDCDERRCDASRLSNACEVAPGGATSFRDEHFAFIPSAAGRWYIGIDDEGANAGGVYVLDAIRPSCGDGERDHGESCEGEEFCNLDCRFRLNAMNSNEGQNEPNDNREEANALELTPLAGEAPGTLGIEITGDVGPSAQTCDYPDVFTFDVPAGGQVEVDALERDGSDCSGASPDDFAFDLFLEDATGSLRSSRDVDENGCPQVDVSSLEAGRYFVRLSDNRAVADRPINYRLLFRVSR
ncbi:MAG: PPC domain-containing protein [Myxococcota bacterium]